MRIPSAMGIMGAVLFAGAAPAGAQNRGVEWVSEFQLDSNAINLIQASKLRHGPPDTGWEAYEHGYYRQIDAHRKSGQTFVRDTLLWHCSQTSLSARLANWQDIAKRGPWMVDVMDNRIELTGDAGRRQQAAWGQERSKTWRGEPYERAMANFYVGLAAYQRRDWDTAVVAFRRALAADAPSAEHYRDDFRLGHYFLAKALFRRDGPSAGDLDVALEKAAQYVIDRKGAVPPSSKPTGNTARDGRSGNQTERAPALRARRKPKAGTVYQVVSPYLTRRAVESANLTLLIEAGRAPLKAPGGLAGESDNLVAPAQTVHAVEVYLDGVYVGETLPMVNVYHQALTRGRSGKDAAQVGKAVGKTALVVGLSLFVGANVAQEVNHSWDIYGDMRTWHMLPNEVHLFTTHATPGLHTVVLQAKDAKGNYLDRYEQLWNSIPVRDHDEQVLYLSMLPDRTNTVDQRVLMPVSGYSARKKQVAFQTWPLGYAGRTLREGDTVEVLMLAQADRSAGRNKVKTQPITHRLPARVTKVGRGSARAELLLQPEARIGSAERVVLPFSSVPPRTPQRVMLASAKPAAGAATGTMRGAGSADREAFAAPRAQPTAPAQRPERVARVSPPTETPPAAVRASRRPRSAERSEKAAHVGRVATVPAQGGPVVNDSPQTAPMSHTRRVPAPAGPDPSILVPGVSLADVHLALSKAGFGAAREWGQYGPLTTRNVKRFQYDHYLKKTGVVDAKTWEVLGAYR